MGRVEETHELMIQLEQLEKARENERMALSNSAPKVPRVLIKQCNAIIYLIDLSWI